MSMTKVLIPIVFIIVLFSCRNNSSSGKVKSSEKRDYNELSFDTLSAKEKDNFFNYSKSTHVLVDSGYYYIECKRDDDN